MDNQKIVFNIEIDAKSEYFLQQVIDNYNDSYQTDFRITNLYIHTDGWCFCKLEVSPHNETHIFHLGYELAKMEFKES